MEFSQRVHDQWQAVDADFMEHKDAIGRVQADALDDILPRALQQDGLLVDSAKGAWAKEWLSDESVIFRFFRRYSYTQDEALKAIEETLNWRLSDLYPPPEPPPTPMLRVLPSPTSDKLNRPIVVFQVRHLHAYSLDLVKSIVAKTFELVELRIRDANAESRSRGGCNVHQFVLVFDVEGASIRSSTMDLMSWLLKVIAPRFAGTCGTIFVVNYSWAHAGLWGFAKRILPDRILSRIVFTQEADLRHYISPDCLLKAAIGLEYGGSLDNDIIADSLALRQAPRTVPSALDLDKPPVASTGLESPSPLQPIVTILSTPAPLIRISSMSLLNPFFGYPVEVSSDSIVPLPRNGRRRKRDLVKTLARLWILRIRGQWSSLIWIVMLGFVLKWLRELQRGTMTMAWWLVMR
ncbi:hypothetical protein BOTBODRAFT_168474 [Botryobasidium botryosum FD-172 SS1]|uniref:CRAL-TRIO domain-containing protein n=1 Tax=Botryobasidium botryosum (strain FD-172 SS1) TaxID=930990 RepID=A0A067NBH4_BOTB1|nr:hypothetical protein BOTBODRAFT_168474 [Botryobasidium botryosum FD-172 SS1]